MKKAICKMCGGHFIQYSPHDHNCPSCESAFDEPDEADKKQDKKELDAI